jgi:hypothetical protein
MRRGASFSGWLVVGAWVAGALACGAWPQVRTDGLDDGGSGAADAGGWACQVDENCNEGMVCEGCGDGTPKQCVPGCRTSAQCPPSMACAGPVACLTCPCAPGWCDLDPCRDVDGDGFVPTSRDPVSCPGKQPGDCDDANSHVHPGAVEVCANGLDDDCNGKFDQQDTAACDQCASGSWACNEALHCGDGQQCTRGCCGACPLQGTPTCGVGECAQEGPRLPGGCKAPSTCVACASCPGVAPVCGDDFATYQNACLATGAGVGVLHQGACTSHEGLACETNDWCGTTLYCGVARARCVERPSCFDDADCPLAVQATVLCGDGGVAALECVAHRCLTKCQ